MFNSRCIFGARRDSDSSDIDQAKRAIALIAFAAHAKSTIALKSTSTLQRLSLTASEFVAQQQRRRKSTGVIVRILSDFLPAYAKAPARRADYIRAEQSDCFRFPLAQILVQFAASTGLPYASGIRRTRLTPADPATQPNKKKTEPSGSLPLDD